MALATHLRREVDTGKEAMGHFVNNLTEAQRDLFSHVLFHYSM